MTVKYATDYDLQKQGGTLTQGDVSLGKALAKLTGTYQSQGESTILNMKLNADGMPVDDLQAMLPALGIILPSGSKLQGGTLSVNVGIAGPVDKLVIAGPIRLSQTKLQGFNLASKMSAISALSGAQTGSDTSIQNLSTDARVAPEGVRTQNINLTIPALGTVTGNGNISPARSTRLQDERESFRRRGDRAYSDWRAWAAKAAAFPSSFRAPLPIRNSCPM